MEIHTGPLRVCRYDKSNNTFIVDSHNQIDEAKSMINILREHNGCYYFNSKHELELPLHVFNRHETFITNCIFVQGTNPIACWRTKYQCVYCMQDFIDLLANKMFENYDFIYVSFNVYISQDTISKIQKVYIYVLPKIDFALFARVHEHCGDNSEKISMYCYAADNSIQRCWRMALYEWCAIHIKPFREELLARVLG